MDTSLHIGPHTCLGPINGLRLTGSGIAFPKDANADAPELDNDGVARFLASQGVQVDPDLDPYEKWGCQTRQWAQRPGEPKPLTNVAEMAIIAGQRALLAAGRTAQDMDLLLVATSTPDRITSSLAARVAKGLGTSVGAVDIRGGGAGGLLAILHAVTMIHAGLTRVLVIASEAGAGFVHPGDVPGVHLYADGAGAVVVEREETKENARKSGLVVGLTGTQSASGAPFTVPGPLPVQAGALASGDYVFGRPDPEYLEHLASAWKATSQLLATQVDVSTIDRFLPYPVTKDQIESARAALGVEPSRVVADVAQHGVLGGAGCLVSLHRVLSAGGGGRLALSAVAGGIVWCVLVWDQ